MPFPLLAILAAIGKGAAALGADAAKTVGAAAAGAGKVVGGAAAGAGKALGGIAQGAGQVAGQAAGAGGNVIQGAGKLVQGGAKALSKIGEEIPGVGKAVEPAGRSLSSIGQTAQGTGNAFSGIGKAGPNGVNLPIKDMISMGMGGGGGGGGSPIKQVETFSQDTGEQFINRQPTGLKSANFPQPAKPAGGALAGIGRGIANVGKGIQGAMEWYRDTPTPLDIIPPLANFKQGLRGTQMGTLGSDFAALRELSPGSKPWFDQFGQMARKYGMKDIQQFMSQPQGEREAGFRGPTDPKTFVDMADQYNRLALWDPERAQEYNRMAAQSLEMARGNMPAARTVQQPAVPETDQMPDLSASNWKTGEAIDANGLPTGQTRPGFPGALSAIPPETPPQQGASPGILSRIGSILNQAPSRTGPDMNLSGRGMPSVAATQQAAGQMMGPKGQGLPKKRTTLATPLRDTWNKPGGALSAIPVQATQANPDIPWLRADAPPELVKKVQQALAAKLTPEEIMQAADIQPYLMR